MVALLAANPASWGLPGGGSPALRAYVVPLVALASWQWWPGGRSLGRPSARGRGADAAGRTADVVVVHAGAAAGGAGAGTGNALAFLAVNQFACWAALMVAACTMPGRRPVARALAVSATACAVVVAATTGADGLLRHPYRTAAWSEATTAVGGTGPLATMRVDAATAAAVP